MGGAGPGATTFSYGYDASARLTSIAINQPAFEWMPTLAYGRSYGAANALNQISSAGGTAVGWDADGNMTSDGVNTYSWTYGNRMSGASRAGMTATYDYDTDDRRTKKTVDGVVTRTLWSGADELAELDTSGNVLRRFVPDGTGAMDARLATVANTGDVYWLHVDHQGSVIATSDSAGQTVGVAAYSPFGEFGDGQSAPPQHSPFGFTGRQYDPETGLYQYRARYYSPRLGQFLSTDPVGTQDDPNLYMYVGLDPVNATDPTGMVACNRETGICPVTDERTDSSDAPYLAGMIQAAYEDAYAWARSNPDAAITVSANVFSSSGEWSSQNISVSGAQIASALERTDVIVSNNAYGINSTNAGEVRISTGNVASTSDLSRNVSSQNRIVSVYSGSLAPAFNKRALVSHEIGWSVMLSPQIHPSWTLSRQGQAAAGSVPRVGAPNQRSTGFAEQLMRRVW